MKQRNGDGMAKVVVVGSFVQDFAFRTGQFPAPGETRIGQFATGPGGKGFNQAVACCRQDKATLFIGACGQDMFGDTADKFARDNGMATALEVHGDMPSGAASIVIDETAQNQIVVALGANAALSTRHIDANATAITDAAVLATQLESALPATHRALELARAAGTLTILNPAPINPDLSLSLLDDVDVLTPNETEFAFLAKTFFDVPLAEYYWRSDHDALHALCRRLAPPVVIITVGGDGCFVSLSETAARTAACPPFFTAAPAPVSPVDTAGAGDAFSGGLASALADTGLAGLEAAVEKANQVAGLSTERPGTAPAMPTALELSARF